MDQTLQEVNLSPQRCRETEGSSFFGSFVYDQVVPRGHFLRQLRELIPWERFSQRLLAYYHAGALEGRPPHDPALLLRMLLLAFPYNLSERQQVVDSVHTEANVDPGKEERKREGEEPRDPGRGGGRRGEREEQPPYPLFFHTLPADHRERVSPRRPL